MPNTIPVRRGCLTGRCRRMSPSTLQSISSPKATVPCGSSLPQALETITENRYGKLQDSQLETHDFKAVYPMETAHHSVRSAPQQAVFTVCKNVLADHSEVISDAFAGQEHRYPLNRVIVPAGLKNEFLSRLRTMNITPSSLFPGLDGLGRAARDYIRLRAWRTHSEGKTR